MEISVDHADTFTFLLFFAFVIVDTPVFVAIADVFVVDALDTEDDAVVHANPPSWIPLSASMAQLPTQRGA